MSIKRTHQLTLSSFYVSGMEVICSHLRFVLQTLGKFLKLLCFSAEFPIDVLEAAVIRVCFLYYSTVSSTPIDYAVLFLLRYFGDEPVYSRLSKPPDPILGGLLYLRQRML